MPVRIFTQRFLKVESARKSPKELIRKTDFWASTNSLLLEWGQEFKFISGIPNNFDVGSWLSNFERHWSKIWIRNCYGVNLLNTFTDFSWNITSDIKLHSAWEKKNQIILSNFGQKRLYI